MKKKIMSLFLTFLRIGAFTFGGGYAMIPLIQKEMVEEKKWLSDKEIMDVIAIAESTPGPIAVNAATFVGYKVAGVVGAAMATLGVVLPSFLIIMLISLIYDLFKQLEIVEYAFWGIRVGVLALIIKALVNMFKQCKKDAFAYVIMGLIFMVALVFKVNVLILIVAAAVAGIVIQTIKASVDKKKE